MSLQFIHNIDGLRIRDNDALVCLQGDRSVATIDLYGTGETPMPQLLQGLYETPDLPILRSTRERRGDITLSAFDVRDIETRDEGERVRVMIRCGLDICIWVNK